MLAALLPEIILVLSHTQVTSKFNPVTLLKFKQSNEECFSLLAFLLWFYNSI